MRKVLALLVPLVLFGCNLDPGLPTSGSTNPSVDSDHMQLATSSGYEVLSRENISGVNVSLNGADERAQPCDRYFPGDEARAVLAPISLHQPQKYTLGGVTTGQITIYYRDSLGEATKRLVIKNYNIIEDSDYPQVHYQSSKPFNSSWGC